MGRDNLVIVAILDEAGKNVYEGDKSSFIRDWPAYGEDDNA